MPKLYHILSSPSTIAFGSYLVYSAVSARRKARKKKDQIELIRHTLTHFHYYNQLSESGKTAFEHRTLAWAEHLEFKGMQGLEVTDPMRVLVAASAAQITFGLKNYLFGHFHTVYLYPDSYQSSRFDDNLLGMASTRGYVTFSWKHFVAGYADNKDAKNLGLHEWAHAMKINAVFGSSVEAQFNRYYPQFRAASLSAFNNMQHTPDDFLKCTAAENIHEFWAECVEHFFEQAGEFKTTKPEIYHYLCKTLNQDPCNISGDYQFRTSGKFQS
jgi:Mlc titration factor MtfA (ptsG expression regulator)